MCYKQNKTKQKAKQKKLSQFLLLTVNISSKELVLLNLLLIQ